MENVLYEIKNILSLKENNIDVDLTKLCRNKIYLNIIVTNNLFLFFNSK